MVPRVLRSHTNSSSNLSPPYQDKFRSVVASVVATHVDTVSINSIKEVTTTRHLLRQLLSSAVEIDFSVRVTDVVAGAALVFSGALAKDKLDVELVKQVFVLVSMRVNIKHVFTYTYIICEHTDSTCGGVYLCINMSNFKQGKMYVTTSVTYTHTRIVSVVDHPTHMKTITTINGQAHTPDDSLHAPIYIHTGSDSNLQGSIAIDCF